MECELLEIVQTEHFHSVIGKIVNVTANEKVLDADGKVDVSKLDAIIFDQFRNSYYAAGERVAGAWDAGKPLMK
jgi:flavin reductase (DIM6/NTAB) family NADH-FMN oxidoreductase RutF